MNPLKRLRNLWELSAFKPAEQSGRITDEKTEVRASLIKDAKPQIVKRKPVDILDQLNEN